MTKQMKISAMLSGALSGVSSALRCSSAYRSTRSLWMLVQQCRESDWFKYRKLQFASIRTDAFCDEWTEILEILRSLLISFSHRLSRLPRRSNWLDELQLPNNFKWSTFEGKRSTVTFSRSELSLWKSRKSQKRTGSLSAEKAFNGSTCR